MAFLTALCPRLATARTCQPFTLSSPAPPPHACSLQLAPQSNKNLQGGQQAGARPAGHHQPAAHAGGALHASHAGAPRVLPVPAICGAARVGTCHYRCASWRLPCVCLKTSHCCPCLSSTTTRRPSRVGWCATHAATTSWRRSLTSWAWRSRPTDGMTRWWWDTNSMPPTALAAADGAAAGRPAKVQRQQRRRPRQAVAAAAAQALGSPSPSPCLCRAATGQNVPCPWCRRWTLSLM